MATIAIKRAYDPPSSEDGLRILVDRLWPRGVRKEDLALDFWAKDIAPSDELRKWFDHRPERFAEFKRRYLAELKHNPAVADVRARIGKAKATLVYGAKDPAINHAVVLAAFLKPTGASAASKRVASASRSKTSRSKTSRSKTSRSQTKSEPAKAPRRRRARS
jgi:uncharacterized protein YeaO (DUF488 family)